jgi:hypothetical protein
MLMALVFSTRQEWTSTNLAIILFHLNPERVSNSMETKPYTTSKCMSTQHSRFTKSSSKNFEGSFSKNLSIEGPEIGQQDES